jgi:hypothetical protein
MTIFVQKAAEIFTDFPLLKFIEQYRHDTLK